MPLLDMQPSDVSCVLSTLKYIQLTAKKLNQTPKLTFDLPLYVKAAKLKLEYEDLDDVVIFLGQFHQQKAFITAITTLMTGSGLSAILTAVYGDKSGIICKQITYAFW